MKTEEKEYFLQRGFFWCLCHRKKVQKHLAEIKQDNKRLQGENEHLVEYNKKLENHLRERTNEIKKLQKELRETKASR